MWRKNANDGRLCFSRENEGSRGVRACARACAFGRVLGRGSRGRIRASRPLRWRGAGARWSGRSANFVGGPETTTRRAEIDGRGALEPKITPFSVFCDRKRVCPSPGSEALSAVHFGGNFEPPANEEASRAYPEKYPPPFSRIFMKTLYTDYLRCVFSVLVTTNNAKRTRMTRRGRREVGTRQLYFPARDARCLLYTSPSPRD